MKFQSRRSCRGTTVVEFAVVATTLLVTLFIVIDVSRLIYLRVLLEEGVRRGARLAAVCSISNSSNSLPRLAAVFKDSDSGLSIPGAKTSDVDIRYLDADGAVVTPSPTTFHEIRFVRVSLVGITAPLFVPFVSGIFSPMNVSATASAGSLGVPPTPDADSPC